MSEYNGCSSECLWFQDSTWYRCFLLKSNTDCSGWCGYMKGGLPERVPALPILMLISSSSCCSEASSAFSFICLASWGRVKAKWGSVPTPCRWQKGCKRLLCNLGKNVNETRWFVINSWPKIAWGKEQLNHDSLLTDPSDCLLQNLVFYRKSQPNNREWCMVDCLCVKDRKNFIPTTAKAPWLETNVVALEWLYHNSRRQLIALGCFSKPQSFNLW